MARRNVLPGLALFLALFVLASGFLQAAPLAPASGVVPVRSAGFGMADFWSALQWLLGSWTQDSPTAATQRASIPKEGPGLDPNGSPKPSPPSLPPAPITSSAPPGEAAAAAGKHGGRH